MFLISLTSISAYYRGVIPIYNYYDEHDNIPLVVGPIPREFWVHQDAGRVRFVHDDFNHYDEFIGYKDLDVFNPDGTIDVIRNQNSIELDRSNIPEDMEVFGHHVYGVLPGGSTYRKHYLHEHPWDMDVEYGHGYGYYGYGYFAPYLAYKNKPVYNKGCQPLSACQYRHCNFC